MMNAADERGEMNREWGQELKLWHLSIAET
jgi:hypothetical protein